MPRIKTVTVFEAAIPQRDGSVKYKTYRTEEGARRAITRAKRVNAL